MKHPILFATVLSAVAIAGNSFAGQEVSGATDGKKIINSPISPEPEWLVDLKSSYTFDSDFKDSHHASGDAIYNGVDFSRRFPLAGLPALTNDGAWYFRIGGEYSRWDFNHSGHLPLPDHLQAASADIALEYLVKGQTGFLLETEPGVYFENDVRSNNFDAPTKLALAYPVTDSFAIVAGVDYTGLRSYQFLPIGGFVWTINDQWKINALPPQPRIIYTATDKLQLWAGGELAGGSFRVDEKHRRDTSLNNAVLDYYEWRAGAGFTYKVGGVSFDLGAGYAFYRKFDFHRAEEGFETKDGAAYVKLQIGAAF